MTTTSFVRKTLGVESPEPPAAHPAGEAPTTFAKKPKLAGAKSRKRDIPEGIWRKCKKCSNMIYDKELDTNLKVCPKCQFHFPISARERIHTLVETCSFEENDASMESVDVLQFHRPFLLRRQAGAVSRNPPASRMPSAPASGGSGGIGWRWA